MIRNNHGFVLPFTLIVVTIVIFFFLNQLNTYVLEKKYYYELEGTMIADTLMEMAVHQLKKNIEAGEIAEGNFILAFRQGKAEISVQIEEKVAENLLLDQDEVEIEAKEEGKTVKLYHMIVTCITNHHTVYQATFTYDEVLQKIVNWVE